MTHHPKLDYQTTTLERPDSIQKKGLVPRVACRDRIYRDRMGYWMLARSRHIFLDTSPNSISVRSPVLLLIDHLGKLALGGLDDPTDFDD
jgi:hypothetical protein